MIDEMKKNGSYIENKSGPTRPDTLKAWEKLHARLKEDNLLQESPVVAKNNFFPALFKVAAIGLILIIAGVWFYTKSYQRSEVQLVSIITSDDPNTLIKTLKDGSVIYLGQNSRFAFPRDFKPGSRNVELSGEAFFDISPDKAKPFIIETEDVIIQVLGTAFNVKSVSGSGFELSVDRGKVKVTRRKDPSVTEIVLAGEKITSGTNSFIKSANSGQQSNWYKERMQFKDETLKNIISVLNRNFHTTFVVADEETGSRRLTVAFHNETSVSMAEILCLALNLKSQTLNGKVILSGNNEGNGR